MLGPGLHLYLMIQLVVVLVTSNTFFGITKKPPSFGVGGFFIYFDKVYVLLACDFLAFLFLFLFFVNPMELNSATRLATDLLEL